MRIKGKRQLALCVISFIFSLMFIFSVSAQSVSQEAVNLRSQGLQLQQRGDYNGAIGAYMQAIQTEPNYATAYNDLGVAMELSGQAQSAEQYYLRALQIEPNYAGVYSNLAAYYEKQGDINRALAYWQKRATLGGVNDPWTQKAQQNAARLQQMMMQPSYRASSGQNMMPSYGNTAQNELAAIEQMMIDERGGYSADAMMLAEEPVVPVSNKKQYRQLVSSAKQDLKNYRYQEALEKLGEARSVAQYPHKVEPLLDAARSESIEYELARAAMTADLYKKTKLVEVENMWYPPVAELEEVAGVAELSTAMKSPARLELERKASEVIPAIDFTQAQLKEVVEFLAVSNDINIVIDETVVSSNETVTIHLKSIPLSEALDIILRTKGLKHRYEENIIWITTEEKLLEEDLEVRVYDVQDLVGKLFDFPSQPFDFKANLELGSESE